MPTQGTVEYHPAFAGRHTAGAAKADPFPQKLTTAAPAALLVKLNTAERRPDAEGEKLTVTKQLAPTATVLPQLFEVTWKSFEFTPAMAMLEMFTVDEPVFEIVIVLAAPMLVRG